MTLTHYYVFVLWLISCALCEDCVRYTFENDFDSLFSKQVGVCIDSGMTFWKHSNYSTVSIDGPRGAVGSFITPLPSWSCVSSFTFPMRVGGVVEVNIYMDPASQSDQITLLAMQKVDAGTDATVGTVFATPLDQNFVRGWQTLKVTVIGVMEATYDGYITLLGIASANSLVLVDSFRYLPPSITDKSMCDFYEDYSITTTAPQTTSAPSVPEPTTPGRCLSKRFRARQPHEK